MRRTAFVVAALVALSSVPAFAGEPVAILEPDALVLPMAAGFLQRVGAIHVNDSVDARVYALGGEGAPRFEVISGRLPDGISIDREGRLVGPFLAAGTFMATVRVGDVAGQREDVPVEMVVLPAAAVR